MKAVIESIGDVGSRVRLGGHELIFDQPTGVPGGADRGPSPLDAMVVSVAACAHYFAAAYLHGRGMSTDGLTVEVEATKERLPVSRIQRIAMKVRLPAPVSERHVSGVQRAIRACPAYGTLLHPPALEIGVEAAAQATDERPTV